jgi:hypothetical protein
MVELVPVLRIIYQGKPKAQHTGAECNIPVGCTPNPFLDVENFIVNKISLSIFY